MIDRTQVTISTSNMVTLEMIPKYVMVILRQRA